MEIYSLPIISSQLSTIRYVNLLTCFSLIFIAIIFGILLKFLYIIYINTQAESVSTESAVDELLSLGGISREQAVDLLAAENGDVNRVKMQLLASIGIETTGWANERMRNSWSVCFCFGVD